jgi:hypothetical protein
LKQTGPLKLPNVLVFVLISTDGTPEETGRVSTTREYMWRLRMAMVCALQRAGRLGQVAIMTMDGHDPVHPIVPPTSDCLTELLLPPNGTTVDM